jgi:O-antigen ligase
MAEEISQVDNNVKQHIKFALVILSIYMFARPIAAMNISVSFASFSFTEVFAVLGSLFLLSSSAPQLKINNITLFIFFYCIYCIFNSMTGGKYREIARHLLPFVCFLSTYSIIKEENDLRKVINFLLLGFAITIWVNAFYVYKGWGVGLVLFHTQLSRYQGLFRNVHSMAHIMLLYSFIYYFYYLRSHLWYDRRSKIKDIFLFLTLCLSVFCIYRSVTRTTMVGFFCFWFLILILQHRKLFIVCVAAAALVLVLNTNKVRMIFYDVDKAITINAEYYRNLAGGGRIYLWKYNWQYFMKLPLERKLVGIGIGNEGIDGTAREGQIPESHNDFLTLLITIGIFGLSLYIMLLFLVVKRTKSLEIDKHVKTWLLCLVITVMIMNVFSNSYISRFELSQIFWFLLGLPITIYEISKKNRLPSLSLQE